MADDQTAPPGAQPWWHNLWLRAVLLHPLGFVLPPVALCLVLAALGSDDNAVDWGLWVVPVCAIASLVTTAAMVVRHGPTLVQRIGLLLLGAAASGGALCLGFYGWLAAAAIACHGGYECPF